MGLEKFTHETWGMKSLRKVYAKFTHVYAGNVGLEKFTQFTQGKKKFTQETQSLRKVYAGLRGLRFLTKSLRRKRRFTQETQVNAEGSLLMITCIKNMSSSSC